MAEAGPGWSLPARVGIVCEPDAPPAPAQRLASELELLGVDAQLGAAPSMGAPCVRMALDAGLAPQGYRLAIDRTGAEIHGGDEAGLLHAGATLVQLARLASQAGRPLALPGVRIDDRPDFAARGFLLDVSRDRVPTMATLFALADLLARLKANELQLYTEHTFAYRNHASVWRDASPITAGEMRALDRHCRARGIRLVPCQQSFGHMHRWLKHAPYRHLAEVPEGIEHAFSREREPYGLCPTDPAGLALLAELYDELLDACPSPVLNTGLDEPVDLGRGRSQPLCDAHGKERVYADFLRSVAALLAERGARMQFFADGILPHADLWPEIPRDAIATLWGYEADHPLEAETRAFARAERAFHVAPGTSSWQSLTGRTANAVANLNAAARAGLAAGASGCLVTDWGDRGHLQPLPVSYAGIVQGLAASWNAGAAAELDLARALDDHAFEDRAGVAGRAACELGDAHRAAGVATTNGSAPFFLLAFADQDLPHPRLPGLTASGLERVQGCIEDALQPLAGARMARGDADLVRDELTWAAELSVFACRLGRERLRGGAPVRTASLPSDVRRALAQELAPLAERHRALWLARSRPGGLTDSAGWLERVLASLRSG